MVGEVEETVEYPVTVVDADKEVMEVEAVTEVAVSEADIELVAEVKSVAESVAVSVSLPEMELISS